MANKFALTAGLDDTPVVNIQSTKRIGKSNYFATVFSSVNGLRAYREEEFANVIAEVLDNRFGLEADTLVCRDYGNAIYSCVIGANTESIEYNDTNLAERGLHSVSANVFADDSDHLWRLVGSDKSARLVQVSQDDFEGFLATRRQRNIATAAMVVASGMSESASEMDFVHFFNPEIDDTDVGFIVRNAARDRVLSKAQNLVIDIPKNSVISVACVEGEESPLEKKLEVAAASGDYNDVIDYMRKLYGNSEMMRKLETLVRQNHVR